VVTLLMVGGEDTAHGAAPVGVATNRQQDLTIYL
jgi:hypothetical protein